MSDPNNHVDPTPPTCGYVQFTDGQSAHRQPRVFDDGVARVDHLYLTSHGWPTGIVYTHVSVQFLYLVKLMRQYNQLRYGTNPMTYWSMN